MRPVEQSLTQYAAYHRDRRNIATHFVGVPLVVFQPILMMATVAITLGPVSLTLAALVSIFVSVYYLMLDRALGLAMVVILFVMNAIASEMTARWGTGGALAWSLGIFVVGWAIQAVGHKFEGVKPALMDDLSQALMGPLFMVAEVFFACGAKQDMRRYIEQRVGPTASRRDGRPLPLGTDPDFGS